MARARSCGCPRNNPAVLSKGFSAGTSVRQVPLLHRRLIAARTLPPGTINLDLGGGRFDDATEALRLADVLSFVYDPPPNRTEAHNRAVLDALEDGRAHTATIANVLNVIPEASVRRQVLEMAHNAVRPGGTVYIDVYEGDRKKGAGNGIGRVTKKGCWQEYRKLDSYLPEVRAVFPKARFETIAGVRFIVAPR